MKTIIDGEKIISLRKLRGWEQQDLAAHAQIHSSVISRMERGLQGDFKVSVIAQIAQALEVTVDQLLTSTWQRGETEFSTELEISLRMLSSQPDQIQQQVAAIIVAYLEHMPKEEK